MLKDFFATGSYKNEEIISAISLYFESKNYYLKRALLIKIPLDKDKKLELRIAYSNYFLSLMSGIEVLLESKYRYSKEFKDELFQALSFENSEGENSYNYLRELRNSIVHRGFDITNAATIINDIPLFIAPIEVPNQSGNKSYKTFGNTIIELIEKIESVIGKVILEHIEGKELFAATYTSDFIKKNTLRLIPKITHMPVWAKEMAIKMLSDFDFEKLPNNQNEKLKEILNYNPIQNFSKQLL